MQRDEEHILTIDCYTDASYSKQANGSVIGYKVGDQPIVMDFLPLVKNTQAEVMAVNLCVAECETIHPESQIHVHTDCQKAIRSQYPENMRMHKMIGHIKKDLRDEKQIIFAMVDRAVRKELRKKHKEIEMMRNGNTKELMIS